MSTLHRAYVCTHVRTYEASVFLLPDWPRRPPREHCVEGLFNGDWGYLARYNAQDSVRRNVRMAEQAAAAEREGRQQAAAFRAAGAGW